MEIKKFTKVKGNAYVVTIDDEEYKLYDDTIIHFAMLQKKTIDETTLEKALSYNKELEAFYFAIKYLTKRLRTEKEIRSYLKKHDYQNSLIDKTIKKLYAANYLNEELYLKSYINDAINLSNNGPKKILYNLNYLGLDAEAIQRYLAQIDDTIWQDKITAYIEKKIGTNKNSSANRLKLKIVADLVNLGYDKEQVVSILNRYNIDDRDVLKKEIIKEKKRLAKKYAGQDLLNHLKMNLYRKGYTNIEEYYDEE